MTQPKILCFDIESAGVNALNADLGFVIVFGYKWNYEKRAHSIVIDEASLRRFNDKKLLKEASKLLEAADIVVAHFGSVFDRRFINGRLLIHGLPPVPNTKMRDTCMIARSVAKFSSNRLKHLAKILGLRHQKLDNNWPTAWFKVMQGDMKALKGLAHYCEGDVLALEDLFFRLAPFDNNLPRLFTEGCRYCGSPTIHKGYRLTDERRYRRLKCTNPKCRKWDRERKALKNAIK